MKIFLDIGAHIGETLAVVLDPRWRFDRIVCFEPAPECWVQIEAIADNRVELCQFGLWSEDTIIALNNPGHVGASIASDKDAVTGSIECDFIDAGAWFEENVDIGDSVYAKINVEGAEADLVHRLYETQQLSKIDHLLIHFDVRKVPSLRDREPELLRQLNESGVRYQAAEDIQYGGVTRGTRNWLRWVEGDPRTRDFRFKVLRRAGHSLRRHLYPLKRRLLRLAPN